MSKQTSEKSTRRDFIKDSATLGAAGAVGAGWTFASTANAQEKAASSDKFRIGFIGPGGRGFGAHVKSLCKLQVEGQPIELVAVCDVYNKYVDRAADYIKQETGNAPSKYVDYLQMIEKEDLDAVCIGTPDHWHHKQVVDSLNSGLHVYCEKPMTKTVEEAVSVLKTWRASGKVMQVGVQSTSLPLWPQVNELLRSGKLGKVLMYQTEYFRNSSMGQWRYYGLEEDMNPKNIDWRRWLGVDEGLVDYEDFDREIYAQWRRFWAYGSGHVHGSVRAPYDIYVEGHRFEVSKTSGWRRRGIFIEYDGRGVPDVATVVADFKEGVQGLVTATMASQATPVKQVIRGHNGSLVFGNGEGFDSFDFIPERPQVTLDSKFEERNDCNGEGRRHNLCTLQKLDRSDGCW